MDPPQPHVVILPFPAQGHIKPMLTLAELLTQAGFPISFINTEHNHRRLLAQIDPISFHRRCPVITFLSIPDGLPPDHPRVGRFTADLFISTANACSPFFKNLIVSMSPLPACIISDGIMSFAIDVADELEIPAISFRTYSATCTWTYFHLENLIKHRAITLPLQAQGNEEMDKIISCEIPGLENML